MPHLPHSASQSAAIPSHLSPAKDKRRVSFISYNDLLLATPTTVTPLGDITSGTLSPDHLPGNVSPNVNTRSPIIPPPAGLVPPMDHKPSWDTGMGTGVRASGLGFGEGEWQNLGLGKGLEQRLENLVNNSGKS